MQRRKALIILAAPLVAAALLVGAAPAGAAVSTPTPTGGYVIVNPSAAVHNADGRTFYPTGPVSDDTLVVIPQPDGTLPNGLTKAKLDAMQAQAKSEGTTVVAQLEKQAALLAAPTKYGYGATSVDWSPAVNGASKIGLTEATRITYSFEAAWGTSQQNAGRGIGYYKGYNGGSFGTWSAWYGLGSAGTGGHSQDVPWGNVAAVMQFSAKCATSTGCSGYFWGQYSETRRAFANGEARLAARQRIRRTTVG